MKQINLPPLHLSRIDRYFICILALGIVMRLFHFTQNYQIDRVDVTGDYLIAHHIVTFDETIAVGPINGVFTTIPNTPLYYYFLAAPLYIYDSIYTHAYVNVGLQILTIIALYLCTKLLFNPISALLVGIVACLNQQWIYEAFFSYQPWYTRSCVAISYMLLAWGYTQKNHFAITLSTIAFAISTLFGFYAFPLLPLYVVIVAFSLKHANASTKQTISIVLFFISGIVLFYMPVLASLMQTDTSSFPATITGAFISTAAEFFGNIIPNTQVFSDGIFGADWLPQSVRHASFWIFASLLLLYIRKQSQYEKKAIFIICICIVSFLLLAASTLSQRIVYHQFITGNIIFIILCAESCVFFLKQKGASILGALSTTLLLAITVIHPKTIQFIQNRPSIHNSQYEAAQAINQGFSEAQKKFGQKWPNHVTLLSYDINPLHNASDGIFWPMLEELSHTKLTYLTRHGSYDQRFKPLPADDSYIILICTDFFDATDASYRCANKFSRQYNEHTIIQTLYTGGRYHRYVIYLAKRNNI